jgi:glycosyltransferase involved in cell wall biosynthesis
MISVCVATFNGERHIGEQLASILASPLIGEVIVSDDGSSDRTCEVVRRFEDTRINLVKGPGAGLIRNFESLLHQATGDHIFLADQDDVWLPAKVETLLNALRTADLAICDCSVVDAAMKELHPSFFRLRNSGPGLWRNLLRNSYLGCCMAFNRCLLPRILPFPKGVPMHDWWIGLVAEQAGNVAFVDVPLMLYRRHTGNASTTAQRSLAPVSQRLAWRWTLVRALWSRRERIRR